MSATTVSSGAALWLRLVRASMMALKAVGWSGFMRGIACFGGCLRDQDAVAD